MEEKKQGNFDDIREGNSSKRQTRGNKAREAVSQELPIKDTSALLEEKTKEPKDKANNTRGKLYGACPDVKIRIGDVAIEQHFFVQDTMSYPLILAQPYIMAIRMETKVFNDDSAYARIRSEDERKAKFFLIVPPNHERNRDRLREKPLPRIVEGFKDFGEVRL
uniref:Predicted protein n=1 Tax=Physcomitrium patens TaxID=3218 RepID=A9U4M1_PHYPA